MAAVKKGENQVIANLLADDGKIINMKDGIGNTALMYAVKKGHTETAVILLKKRADPNIQDKSGRTCLIEAILGGNKDIITLLLNNGAYPNIQDELGMTALMYAVKKGSAYADIVRLLLEKDAKIDVKDKNGKTVQQLQGVPQQIKQLIRQQKTRRQAANVPQPGARTHTQITI
jgi:ankyrin repeat protein